MYVSFVADLFCDSHAMKNSPVSVVQFLDSLCETIFAPEYNDLSMPCAMISFAH